MGVAEIIGFAACWLTVAILMLWGVFSEKQRGAFKGEPPAGAWHPSGAARRMTVRSDDWIVVEAADGATPEIADRCRFLLGAWLASRGVDINTVSPADIRTEVTTTGDGHSTTRVLVRAGALNAARRHR